MRGATPPHPENATAIPSMPSMPPKKKAPAPVEEPGPRKRFVPRCFRTLLNALSSPRGALTAVFGMGTGVSPPPMARTKRVGDRPSTNFLPGGLGRPDLVVRPRMPSRARGGGRRPDLTTYQKRYAQRLAALIHPPCRRVVFPWSSGACARDG